VSAGALVVFDDAELAGAVCVDVFAVVVVVFALFVGVFAVDAVLEEEAAAEAVEAAVCAVGASSVGVVEGPSANAVIGMTSANNRNRQTTPIRMLRRNKHLSWMRVTIVRFYLQILLSVNAGYLKILQIPKTSPLLRVKS